MSVKYGLPYMGSKKAIADDIIEVLPDAENLYDLFAGGGAISHCAVLSNRWQHVYANDIQNTMQLFLDAVNGKYADERRWISREQFFAGKDTDPYVRWIWSFGNNGITYIFGRDVEPVKKAAHEYLMANGYDGTMTTRIRLIKAFKAECKLDGRFELQRLQRLEQLEQLERIQQLEQLERLERLQQLEQLERLERLQQLERLQVSALDYRDVPIKPGSVIYCDIPYNQKKVTTEKYYGLSFDTQAFYAWAKACPHPVYFSCCFCDDHAFRLVWSKGKQCTMKNTNSHGNKLVLECLFWNGKGDRHRSDLFL